MNTQYVVFTRKNTKLTILPILPRLCQAGSEIKFFVNIKYADQFKKRGISWESFTLSDLIMVDGKIIKNRWGSTS